MMNSDMHVHSKYSYDSKAKIQDIISKAEDLGLNYVGIVDHVEFSNQSINEILHRIKSRNKKIDELQENTEVTILKGIEISEPHKYPEEMKYIKEISDLDYTLGAIHHVLGIKLQKLTLFDDLEKLYLENLYDMVSSSEINAVAHLDQLKKYITINSDFLSNELTSILKEMIKRKILLEINSNAYDVLNDFSPSSDIVSLYKILGGKNFIFGSDAHKIENIGRYRYNFRDTNLEESIIFKNKIKKLY